MFFEKRNVLIFISLIIFISFFVTGGEFAIGHEVKLVLTNDLDKNTFYKRIDVVSRSDSGLKEVYETGQMGPIICGSYNRCEKTLWVEDENVDLFIFVSEIVNADMVKFQLEDDIRNKFNVRVFIKRIDSSKPIIELKSSSTKQVNSNANEIITKEDLKINNHFSQLCYKESPLAKNDCILSYYDFYVGSAALDFYYDDNLHFSDYFMYESWTGINEEKKKIINYGYFLKYPFSYSAFIDESNLKSVNFHIYNPFKEDSYFLIHSRIFGLGNYWDNSRSFSIVRSPHDSLPIITGEDYTFEFFPSLENNKIAYIIEAHAFPFPPLIFRDIINGGDKYSFPDELSEDINIFKEPFSLKLQEIYEHPYYKKEYRYRYMLTGALVDSSIDIKDGIGHKREVSGTVKFTLPNGDIEIIKDFYSGSQNSWAIDCNYLVDGLPLGYPSDINPEKLCQNGEYKVDWIFGDVFKDKKILELHSKYYFNNGKFLLEFTRGDANLDNVIDLSDVIFMLDSLFKGRKQPNCMDATDVNDDGKFDISDPIYLLNYLFSGGRNPPLPYPEKGFDFTVDELSCSSAN